jgi:hypothetical protein
MPAFNSSAADSGQHFCATSGSSIFLSEKPGIQLSPIGYQFALILPARYTTGNAGTRPFTT